MDAQKWPGFFLEESFQSLQIRFAPSFFDNPKEPCLLLWFAPSLSDPI